MYDRSVMPVMRSKEDRIMELAAYIEAHMMEEDLNTCRLSAVGYSSRMQLHRDFYSLTGHTVKAYIEKRRLSNALAAIKAACVFKSPPCIQRKAMAESNRVIQVMPGECRSLLLPLFCSPL